MVVKDAKADAPRLGSASELDAVVQQLRAITRESGLARTLAIGELVLERFFGGSVASWQDRRRNKNNSIRRLADRPDCPISRSALNLAIGVFVASRGSLEPSRLQHVGASHIAAVLPLPEGDRGRWLVRADAEFWSVRRLSVEIRHERKLAGERRGRPPLSHVPKVLGRARTALEALEKATAELAGLALDRYEEKVLRGFAERLATVERELENRSPAPDLARISVVNLRA